MIRKLITLMLLSSVAFLVSGQDIPPTDSNFKKLQSPSFNYYTTTHRPWMYMGSMYGWRELASWSQMTDTLDYYKLKSDSLAPYGYTRRDRLASELAKKENLLPETPTNPDQKFLNGNKLWAVIPSVGGGGYPNNVYFTTVDSDVSGYKTLNYTPEISSTELTVTLTNQEVLVRSYIYPAQIATEIIDAGTWIANFRIKVSGTQGVSRARLDMLLRHLDNSETLLWSAYSDELDNTTYQTIRKETTQQSFFPATTDRLVAKVYFKTTAANAITFYTIIGDGDGSYFSTPLKPRHDTGLRAWNADPNYQHVTPQAQTFNGVKTFTSSPVVPTPTTNYQASTKKYVDDGLATKENTLTKGNLTAGSTKISVTSGTGSVIGSGTSIDVNEGNLTLSNIGGSVTDTQVPNTITLDNITQVTNRSHTNLTDIGTNTHAQIDNHISSTSNPHSVTAVQVGLGNVTNDAQVKRSEMGVANGVATLLANGKLPSSQVPSIAISETFPITNESDKVLLSSAEKGDIAIVSTTSKSYILKDDPYSVESNWVYLRTPESPIQSVNGMVGSIQINPSLSGNTLSLSGGTATVNIGSATDVAANTAARHSAVTLGTANGLSLSGQQLSLGLSSTSSTGALSSTDWNTFNSKQSYYTNLTGIGSLANGSGFLKNNGNGTFSYAFPTFSEIASKPTTLAGYGIADAVQLNPASAQNGNINISGTGSFGGSITATQLQSTIATGTAPLTVNSTTEVTNLNANLLQGHNAAYFQTALTNPITGTLTSGYMPVATGSGSLGNSNVRYSYPYNSFNISSSSSIIGAYSSVSGQRVGFFINDDTGASGIAALQSITANSGGSALDVGHWNYTTSDWLFRAYNNVSRDFIDIGTGAGTFKFGIRGDGAVIVSNLASASTCIVTASSTGQLGVVSGTGFVKADGSVDSNSYLTSITSSQVTTALGYTPYNSTNPNNYIPLTAISSTATGLTYTNTTGVLSLTSGYAIPTTSNISTWNSLVSSQWTTDTNGITYTNNVGIGAASNSTVKLVSEGNRAAWFNSTSASGYALYGKTTGTGAEDWIAIFGNTNGITHHIYATGDVDHSGGLTLGLFKGTPTTGSIQNNAGSIQVYNGSGWVAIGGGSGSMTWPSNAGLAYYNGSGWGTSYGTSGSGTTVALTTSPSFTTPSLGAATATSINNATISKDSNSNITVGSSISNITTGTYNTSIGVLSMPIMAEGTLNVSLGYQSMYQSTSGANNVSIGSYCLYSNTYGSGNTSIGSTALNINTSGGSNTAIGQSALYRNTTGSGNVAIGGGAGAYTANDSSNSTSELCLYIGNNTKSSASGVNREVVIGPEAVGNGSNTVTIGGSSSTTTYMTPVIVLRSSTSAPTVIEGGIYYNSSTKHFYGYDGTSWKQLDN